MRTWPFLLAGACQFSSSIELPADASGQDAFTVPVDTPGTGTDAAPPAVCYGPTSTPFAVCLGSVPTGTQTLLAAIDTTPGTAGSPCLEAQPVGWVPAQPASCFIIADEVHVPSTTIVTGSRPLVLVAATRIVIDGTLDVASHVGGARGPGVSGVGCGAFARAVQSSINGAGGAAGGSFMTAGGDGGAGDQGNAGVGGQSAPADPSPPDKLRGGCDAQTGGSGTLLSGAAGPGGGVVYLVAGDAIRIIGAVNASGAGGAGGGTRSGGSGGGSGGMIALHAMTIEATGMLLANGGGGASGGTKNGPGGAGEDPISTTAAAGGGGGGQGGDGFAEASLAGVGVTGAKHEGGGGGGGGAGYIRANRAPGSGTFSPSVHVVP